MSKDTPTETLYACTLCGQPGFTRRGLRQHWCSEGQNQKSRQLTKAEWQAMVDTPAKAVAVRDNHELVSFAAKELEPQGQRAINGMIEVLKFHALVSILKADAEQAEKAGEVKSQREIKPLGGRPSKATDLKAIFTKHAPGLNLKSAHRLYDVGCGIAEEYEDVVGKSIARKFDMPTLVTTEPAKLPPPARKKQDALFDYVRGTSQKSWLDKIRPAKERGGDTSKQAKKLTAEEQEEVLAETLKTDCESVGRSVDTLGVAYRILNDAQAEGLRDILRGKADEIDGWLKIPKSKRPVLDKVKAIFGEKH